MIVTPFGDLSFGDKAGLDSWLSAHDQQHMSERQAIAYTGIPLYPRSFEAPMTDDWYGHHMIEHRTLQNFAIEDDSISPTLIEMQWNSPQNFYAWHQIHNLLHQRLDQALGLQGGSLGVQQ